MASFYGKEVFRPAFDDRAVPNISYGLRFPEACARHVQSTFNASRVYIIASKSLSANTDALTRLQNALEGKVAGTRIGMRPHTLWSDLLAIINDARSLHPDCFITLGAGSLTDGAKIIAWALANDACTEDKLATLWFDSPTKGTDLKPPTIPVISIPTSLSGGEYQSRAGGTHDATMAKRRFQAPVKNPALVVLDPELTTSTPQWVWLSTGIRSVDHCVETLCSLMSNPKGDSEAAKGLGTLIPALLKCKHNPQDLEARFQCQLGVIEAMTAVSSGVPMGASHAIGHQLGPFGVGHGETSCVMLPAVCKYNAAKGANNVQQETCVNILMRTAEVHSLMDGKDVDLGDILAAVIRELGLPKTLKDVSVGREKFDALAENSLKDHWLKTNAVPITEKAQVMEILRMVEG